MKHYFHCIKCDKNYNELSRVCRHGNYYNFLEILYDYNKIKKIKTENKLKILKHLLPLNNNNNKIFLGEGNTPLLRIFNFSAICKNNQVFVKNEAQNPAGSFKDRETAIVIAKAVELKYGKVAVISSGNAALSASVYANKANINCECFIPKRTSSAKKLILKLFDANLHLLDCDYERIYRKITDRPPKDAWNITSGKNIYREEGSKAIAFEIWEKIKVPDIIITPMGNGTLMAALYKGYFELNKIGLANKVPQLIGVQIKNSAPIGQAVLKNKDYITLRQAPESVAEGIIARESYDSPKAVRAIKESGGYVIEVTDREIKYALKKIIKTESLIPEPTSAVVYAALNKLKLKNEANKKIVCIQTGSGTKNLEEITKNLRRVK